MRFHVGQDVYVGWVPDHLVIDARARKFRCRCGVILSGPFPPNERMLETWWKVEIEGRKFNAAEKIIFPFDAPEREVCVDDCLELTE